MNYYVGMDLGGTNTKIGLVDEGGNIIFTTIVKTESMEGFEKTIERLSKILIEQVKGSNINYDDVKGVGLGVPGPVVNERVVKLWANFPWPKEVDLAGEFEKHLNRKVKVDNDVNVITLGEMWKGAAQGYKHVLGLAIGTGIGGGIIVDTKLVSGKNGGGGEVGHTKVEKEGKLCGCGQNGCWEAYASATGLIREAKSRLTVHKNNKLYEKITSMGRELEAKDIFDAAKEGDEFSLNLVDYEAEYIALGLGNLLNTLDPEIIVIGGGVALAGDILFNRINEKLHKYALSSTLEGLKILPAQLGNDAGIIGAAYLGMN
ncbi:ROK family protein [Pseudoleptotrichia goodfellowii]|jgi:ROK family protein|uniref:Glucokinase n=1 Tax=Pseudoleptotrichia goodfellowii F0264 TaxID=596323 RepID=D0GLS9_9FUSO|nr:ROK family protein [Pseudoleptotrichia goodfellowii]EEY34870.1 ROK family protein [Pseudoleptotrichia goodfellowii F0264]MBF4806695.1 ROK family protein [Pseudoleptotrichia goodfellowii]